MTPQSSLSERKAIEALRFGLVPTHDPEAITVGYPHLKSWVQSRLPGANGGAPLVSEVVGPFGTGKSHALVVVRHLAREANYLSARVEVDGHGLSLSDPARLLHYLWSTLVGPGFNSRTPLVDLAVRAIKAGKPPPDLMRRVYPAQLPNYYRILQSLVQFDKVEKHRETLHAVLSSSSQFTMTDVRRRLGRDVHSSLLKLRPMIRTRTTHPFDLAMTLVGMAQLARLAGFAGLIITIDEFEVEQLLTAARKRRLFANIEFLADYLRGHTILKPGPLGIFFATVADDGRSGNAWLAQLVNQTAGGRYGLQSWAATHRRDLAQRIHRLYAQAYDSDPAFDAAMAAEAEAELVEEGVRESGVNRAYIKLFVAKLDSRYGPRRDRIIR
jgi:hypothetical protein